ncbi:MAG: DUF2339 domain-containing protein [Gammaproteobacteria bacterium]|nr:DUF2339 domain-containing protein [Gammaproteobacteria bacterium]MDH5650932.1 DUF2339 domain-containing protein [Gammaproteobacteria bacterium]
MLIWIVIFGIAGVILGFMINYDTGAGFGFWYGCLLGVVVYLLRRVNELAAMLQRLNRTVDALEHKQTEQTSSLAATVKPAPAAEPVVKPIPAPPPVVQDDPAPVVEPKIQTAWQAGPAQQNSRPSSATTTGDDRLGQLFDQAVAQVRRFFTEGNVVLKVGLIVLFFGVAFLLKYAAERNILSIEVRLLGVMLGAMVMLVLGWRWRLTKTVYALGLQGGAVGIMFITVFIAAKIYHLIPLLLALVVMLGLVGFCAMLAVLQNTLSLAVLGILGGFLAPILASTGSGNHVMLFSYYALLNLGIFAIAWFKSWRILNLLGFGFTLLIGSLWAESGYRPDIYLSTQLFLGFFILLFTAIALIYALRQPPDLKGLVDGTLVFGVPLSGFGLQSLLVRDIEYGIGISALVLGAFYILLAMGLWRRLANQMRVLTESFLAMGVVFGSLAIPLTLSESWTTLAWSLEGAGLVWIGLRQQRMLARVFGLLLQFGAGVSFMIAANRYMGLAKPDLLILNGNFMGAAMIAVAGLLSAWLMFRQKSQLRNFEQGWDIVLLCWGIVWWWFAGTHEIDVFTRHEPGTKLNLVFISISCVIFYQLFRRLAWPPMVYPALLTAPYAAFSYLTTYAFNHDRYHPVQNFGYLVWPMVFAATIYILLRVKQTVKPVFINLGYLLLFWLLCILLAWQASWLMDKAGTSHAWALLVELMILALLSWQVLRQTQAGYDYLGVSMQTGLLWGLGPVMLWFAGWILLGSFNYAGETVLIPYIPVLNPFGIGCVIALLLLLFWSWRIHNNVTRFARAATWTTYIIVPVLAFIALNSSLARAIHQWTGVRFDLDAMLDSLVFQAGISILWTILAMVITITATRISQRLLWIVGMSLMGIVVGKLFLFDLANTNTLARVVSFLGVGLIMLVMGYFSPLPPHKEDAA